MFFAVLTRSFCFLFFFPQAVCRYEKDSLARCIEANPGDLSYCQSYLDMLNACKQNFSSSSMY